MSRLDRLKEYQNPVSRDNWRGASRDMANIDRWSERAKENSDSYKHRAPSKLKLHDTSEPAGHIPQETGRTKAKIDARYAGRDDPNHVGEEDHMPTVRREA